MIMNDVCSWWRIYVFFVAEEAGGSLTLFNANRNFDTVVQFVGANYAALPIEEVLFSVEDYKLCYKALACLLC